jgi:hypothetical protein
MTKKPVVLVTLVTVVCGLGFYLMNKDLFARRPIQISHRFHAFGGRFDTGGGVAPILFEFNQKLTLNDVKVVSATEALTNKYPHALWEMVSDSNSVPTRGFLYGMNIPGMHPAYKGVVAEPLDPSEKYRLQIKAGSLKAEHDFDLNPSPN